MPDQYKNASSVPMERASTGVSGLDEVLHGGLPRGHLYLIEGDSGAGKTTLGLQFLLAGCNRGERCLWITMSETDQELRETAQSHGWELNGIDILNLALSQEALRAEEKYSFFSPADVELNDTTRTILAAVRQVRPARIVFDPFSDIKYLARDTLTYRRQILALRDFFAEQRCTVLLLQEMTRGMGGDMQAEALTHGYLTLHQESPEYGGQRRRLRIHKMRGMVICSSNAKSRTAAARSSWQCWRTGYATRWRPFAPACRFYAWLNPKMSSRVRAK